MLHAYARRKRRRKQMTKDQSEREPDASVWRSKLIKLKGDMDLSMAKEREQAIQDMKLLKDKISFLEEQNESFMNQSVLVNDKLAELEQTRIELEERDNQMKIHIAREKTLDEELAALKSALKEQQESVMNQSILHNESILEFEQTKRDNELYTTKIELLEHTLTVQQSKEAQRVTTISLLENEIAKVTSLYNQEAVLKERKAQEIADLQQILVERDSVNTAEIAKLTSELKATQASLVTLNAKKSKDQSKEENAQDVKAASALQARIDEISGVLESVQSEHKSTVAALEAQQQSIIEENKTLASNSATLSKQLEDMQAALQTYETQNEELKTEAEKLKEQLIEAEHFVNSKQGELSSRLEQQLAQARLEIAQYKAERDEMEDTLQDLREDYDDLMMMTNDKEQAKSTANRPALSNRNENVNTTSTNAKKGGFFGIF